MAEGGGAVPGDVEQASAVMAEGSGAAPGDVEQVSAVMAEGSGVAPGDVEQVSAVMAEGSGAVLSDAEQVNAVIPEGCGAIASDVEQVNAVMAERGSAIASDVEQASAVMAEGSGAVPSDAEQVNAVMAEGGGAIASEVEQVSAVMAEGGRGVPSDVEEVSNLMAEGGGTVLDDMELAGHPGAEEGAAIPGDENLTGASAVEGGGVVSKRGPESAGHPVDDGGGHRRGVGLGGGPKGCCAEVVDDARDTVGIRSDPLDGLRLEHGAPALSRLAELVHDVGADLGGRQRGEMKAQRGGIILSIRVHESRGEIGLAHQQDGQRQPGLCTDFHELPEPGDLGRPQALRFVDRDQGRPTLTRLFHGDGRLASRFWPRRLGDTQLPSERSEHPVQDRGVVAPEHASARPLHVACHATQHHRLPGSRLAGQQDQAPMHLDGSKELGAHDFMDRARIEEIRICNLAERALPQWSVERRSVVHSLGSRGGRPLEGARAPWIVSDMIRRVSGAPPPSNGADGERGEASSLAGKYSLRWAAARSAVTVWKSVGSRRAGVGRVDRMQAAPHSEAAGMTKPRTVGELRQSGYAPRSVKAEIRQNLIRKLESGERLFPGIVGFDETVLPRSRTRCSPART